MQQVPRYLIIGNGRVSRHFQHYFSLLQLSYLTWQRSQPIFELHQALNSATHVLLLISDNAIKSFIENQLQNYQGIVMHCSGSLVIERAYGAHPMMTFNDNLYALQQYLAIPFVFDHDAPAFAELFPGLLNQHVRLHKALKPKYHALCVLSGNFSCLLWQKLFTTLEQEFDIPHSMAHHYLTQQTQNLLTDPHNALTGPLVRGDSHTLTKNLLALESDPVQNVYQSFVAYYQKINEVKI